jgi:hypothetical protein
MRTSWHIIGASVQGTAHEKKNLPCQDAHLYRLLPEGIVILAVADGAGSAERSDEGAKLAAREVVGHLTASLQQELPTEFDGWQALLRDAFGQARQAILQHAKAEKMAARTFATTLTCAIASHEWLVTGQIGDGVVVGKSKAGQLFSATEPQRGEFANETYFLTMEQALQQLKVAQYIKPIEALAAMTDGLIRLAMRMGNYEPHDPFFKPILAFAAQNTGSLAEQEAELSAFLASKRVSARTDDDKTLLLAVCQP